MITAATRSQSKGPPRPYSGALSQPLNVGLAFQFGPVARRLRAQSPLNRTSTARRNLVETPLAAPPFDGGLNVNFTTAQAQVHAPR